MTLADWPLTFVSARNKFQRMVKQWQGPFFGQHSFPRGESRCKMSDLPRRHRFAHWSQWVGCIVVNRDSYSICRLGGGKVKRTGVVCRVPDDLQQSTGDVVSSVSAAVVRGENRLADILGQPRMRRTHESPLTNGIYR